MTRRTWGISLAVVAAVAAVIVAIVLIAPWAPAEPAVSAPTAPAITPSPAATVGVTDANLADLSNRMTSDDPDVLAASLALEVDQVPAEVLADFPTLEVDFDSAGAEEAAPTVWIIPATVTDAGGSTSSWLVTVQDTPDGLLFVDSTPAEGTAP